MEKSKWTKLSILIVFFPIVIYLANAALFYSDKHSQNIEVAAAATVIMKDLKYSETQITIKQGEVVEFINAGSEEYWPASNIHPSHGIYPEFDPQGPVHPGESWSFKFDRVGSWKFHDHLHNREIKGTIIVTE